MREHAIITLTTDFGGADPYVGAVRGMLLTVCPGARLVDVSHDVPAHDVRTGAFVLAAAAPWFPEGTVHLAVVDPGVGGSRRALVARGRRHLYVGPDNGLLTAALDREPGAEVFAIDATRLSLDDAHPTFHGRDLFAPVAARLAAGLDPEEVGPPAADLVRLDADGPSREGDGALSLHVLHVDRFGNVTTDLARETLERLGGGPLAPELEVETPGGVRVDARKVATYAEAEGDELLVLWGSSGFLELALDRGRADERLGLSPGTAVRLGARGRRSG